MKPLIDQGYKAADVKRVDQEAGRDYMDGFQHIYELYHGSQPIKVDKAGDSYVSMVNVIVSTRRRR
jgi:hypothetical protein